MTAVMLIFLGCVVVNALIKDEDGTKVKKHE